MHSSTTVALGFFLSKAVAAICIAI